ncbi:MAG: hypothetical protein AABY22_04955 [Nanoarchaeota archaeon]
MKCRIRQKNWFKERTYNQLKTAIKKENNINILNRELEFEVRCHEKLTNEQKNELNLMIFNKVI